MEKIKTYFLTITEAEKGLMEDLLNLNIELCKDAIHNNIYFRDKEGVKEGRKELRKIQEMLRKVKNANPYE